MSVPGWTGEAAIRIASTPDDDRELHAVFDRCADSFARYALVRTGGDRHLADDLVQQLWVQASTSARRAPAHELEYWLRAILTNLVRSHWRTAKRRPVHLPIADPRLASDVADRMATAELPVDLLEREEVRTQLLLAITELRHEEQELIVGSYFRGRSHAELAETLNISPRAVEGRLYRARRALYERLKHLADE